MSKETLSTSETAKEKEAPKIKLALEEKYKEEEKNKAPEPEPLSPDNIGDTVDELPEPSGYRILVLPFTPKNKSKGGILFSQETLDKARISTTCGYVLKMGDLAYKDTDKFNQPWCKKGDWVIFARYAGSRLPIEGGEVRILNDDEVLGTIKDPESVLHLI
jgi:co-chaperonin GroES (HSP10)